MDLLSLIGSLTKKRGGYFSQSETLAKRAKTIDKLETIMVSESKLLVEALRDKSIRWEEYSRSLVDKTVIAALAGVYLGASLSKPRAKMEKAWPVVIGSLMPPLIKFLEETKIRIDKGILLIGQKTFEFSDFDIEEMLGDPDFNPEKFEIEDKEEVEQAGIGRTWLGTLSRVIRYIANPAYAFFSLGEYYTKEEQGFKEMRRIARKDRKTCPDCIELEKLGWQPLGSLPMPGQKCRCYDRCRCKIDYR